MPDIEPTQEMYVFRVEDPNCGKIFTIPVPESERQAWVDGALIQDAMPSLGHDDRELLLSGTCPTCWDAMVAVELKDEPRTW